MKPKVMQIREMQFPDSNIKTDSLLYRERCKLLLPEPYTQNMFFAQSDRFKTSFYLASESQKNLGRMEAFFSRLYGAFFENSPLPDLDRENTVVLKNSIRNMRKREFYHPGFVRNLLDYTAIDESARVRYCVSIRSGGKRADKYGWYNFSVSLGFDSAHSEKKFTDLLNYEIRSLKKESGYTLKRAKVPRMGDNLLSNPFNLINFVRVPSEQDLIL